MDQGDYDTDVRILGEKEVQLICDVNLPTPEDPEAFPLCSPRNQATLQLALLDWNAEVEQVAPLSPALEEL